MNDYTITFRPYIPADTPFIQAVYASSREMEMGLVPWTEAEKTRFLEMQCLAQLDHYQTHYHGAEHLIILRDEQPIGRLYLHRAAKEIRLMDVNLLPAYRNQGIGSRIICDLRREGDESNRPVTLHVEIINPDAIRLYQRLGFTVVGNRGMHVFMERLPQAADVPHPQEII